MRCDMQNLGLAPMRCDMQNTGPNTHEPAVVIMTVRPSGNVLALCQRDLDWWLDSADEDPDNEPARLHFLGPIERTYSI